MEFVYEETPKKAPPRRPRREVPEPIQKLLDTTLQHGRNAVLRLSPGEGADEVREIRLAMEAYSRHVEKGLRFKFDEAEGTLRVGLYEKKRRNRK